MAKTTQPMNDYYNEFLKVMDIDSQYVTIYKTPLENHRHLDGPHYNWKFCYPLLKGEEIKCDTMIIDLSLIKSDLIQSPGEFITSKVDIDCSSITFDGENWNLPFADFLATKNCQLIDPFRRCDYFAKIYSPYSNPRVSDEMIRSRFIKTIAKLSKNKIILPQDHRKIWECILPLQYRSF